MSTWGVIKELFYGANIYWRKFYVFAIFAVVLGVTFQLWQGQRLTSASTALSETPYTSYSYQVQYKIEVKPNGQVLLDGKDISKTLKILPDSYEIRLVVIQEPEDFIQKFKAELILPKPVEDKEIGRQIIAIYNVGRREASFVSPNKLVYEVDSIPQGSTVTLVAYLPKNILTPPLAKRLAFAVTQFPVQNYIIFALAMPLITLMILLVMVIKRRKDQIFYVSDKLFNQPPSKIIPSVAGVLFDGQVGTRELAATLIDLANRGYIYIISKSDGNFSFGKRKSLNIEEMPELKPFERILLSKIFLPGNYRSQKDDVDMRVGRHIFSRKIAEVYLSMYNEATQSGYFIKNPVIVHLTWKFTGIALFFFSFLGFMHNAVFGIEPKFTLFFWAGSMFASAVIVRLSGLMPSRSSYGTQMLRQWLSFRKYLSLNKPIEPTVSLMDNFVRLLPYAIVFGVESDWAHRFIKEPFNKPDWYESGVTVETLDHFIGGLFPIISYVGDSLAKSHEPTVE